MEPDFTGVDAALKAAKAAHKRRKRKAPPSHAYLPTVPGWYVQWAGRWDWQELDAATAVALKGILAAPGDRLVEVTAKPE